MKIGELEVSFEPFKLPEDCKFVYKIEGCEHKLNFDSNTIVEKILSARAKIIDEEVIRQLRNIGEEKGINELILIDENKVLKIIESIKALKIILKKDFIDFKLLKRCKTHYEYNSKVAIRYTSRGMDIGLLAEEEFDLLKEELCHKD